MSVLFYWTGIVFWVLFGLALIGGMILSLNFWRGVDQERKEVEEMTNIDILNGAASSLEGIERSLNGVKNVIKDGSMMTFSLESRFSSVVAEIENIRKTFVSMIQDGNVEFTKKEYFVPEEDSENSN